MVRALLLALALAAAPAAQAGWSMSADVEHFRWAEDTSPKVTETGPRFGVGVHWTQDRPAGWAFGYHGRIYFGSVDYSGAELLSNTPLTGTTDYVGMSHEAQATYRFPGSALGAEIVAGLGLDVWERQLSAFQSEDYGVLYLRLGGNLDRRTRGWYGGGGIKLPLSVDENAHFPDIGFVPNPRLEPKGEASPYAEVGYRFDERLSLAGYYDSYRFGESNPVTVIQAATGNSFSFVQPATSMDVYGLRLLYRF
jgi:hypothetical protein